MDNIFILIHESYSLHPRSPSKKQIVNNIRTCMLKILSRENVAEFLSKLIKTKLDSDSQFFLYSVEFLFSFPNVLNECAKCNVILNVMEELIEDAELALRKFKDDDNLCDSNHTCSCLLRIEQVLSRILQQIDSEFVIGCKSFIHKILSLLNQVTAQIPLLDCRRSAAIISVLLLRHNQSDFGNNLFEIVTRHSAKCSNLNPLERFILEQISIDAGYHSSSTNQLSFFLGLLSALTPDNLITESSEHRSLSMAIFNRIMSDINVSESNSRLLVVQLFVQWHQKHSQSISLMSGRNLDICSEILSPRIEFVDYLFMHQDDPVDAIKHSARSLFHLVIKNHHALCHCTSSCSLIQDFIQRVQHLSWDNRGKYSMLTHLVDVFGSTCLATYFKDIQAILLRSCSENSLAHHASDLYMKLMISEVNCQSSSMNPADHGIDPALWLNVILNSYRNGDEVIQLAIVQHFVMKMSKLFPAGLYYMIQKCQEGGHQNMGLLIACLKGIMRRNLKLPIAENSRGVPMWRGIVSNFSLKRAFIYEDEEIRLNALSLITEDVKTTKLVPKEDLQLVIEYIRTNLRSLSPNFRQKFTSLMKNFFIRINDSAISCSKKKPDEFPASISDYQQFYEDAVRLLMSCLYPGCSFPSRSTTLSLLNELSASYSAIQCNTDWRPLPSLFSREDDQRIFLCFADSFEDNKKLALNILDRNGAIHRLNADDLHYLAEKAWTKCRGNRPEDCSLASVLIQFLLHLPSDQFHTLFTSVATCEDYKFVKSCDDQDDIFLNQLLLMNMLLDCLESQVRIGENNLISVAVTHPFYSIISSMHSILHHLSLSRIHTVCPELLPRILKCCYDVARLVSPVVSHSSPEGFNPVEFPEGLLGPGLDVSSLLSGASSLSSLLLDETIPKKTEGHQLSLEFLPEALVLCCWRSIKESSLLLGYFATNGLTEKSIASVSSRIFSHNQVEEMGSFFWHQLLESRHRGAFEIASTGFSMLCRTLWSDNLLCHLPRQWLDKVLSAISADDEVNLCVTRRSGGLPYYLLSLIVSEKKAGSSNLYSLPKVMNFLIGLVPDSVFTDASQSGAEENLIHSLNILRMLYQNSDLSEDLAPYVAWGLKISILGFGSSVWAVRNSSTLLFSALIQRIFGVNRTKELTSKKNCISSRIFFNRYNSLYEFLLSQLNEEIHKSHGFQPKLYSILLLFSRLLPPTMEVTDSVYRLDVFIPLIERCGDSPIIRVRTLASRALTGLIPKSNVNSVIQNLFDDLLKYVKQLKTIGLNSVHGKLLQIRHLMESASKDIRNVTNIEVRPFLDAILDCISFFASFKTNPCYPVYYESIKIILTLSTIDSSIFSHLCWDQRLCLILNCFSRKTFVPSYLPFVCEFFEARCQLYLELILHKWSIPNESLQEFSQSPIVEVRRILLSYLVDYVGSYNRECDVFEQLLLRYINHGDLLSQEDDHQCLSRIVCLYLARAIQPSDNIIQIVHSKLTLIRNTDFQSIGMRFLSFTVASNFEIDQEIDAQNRRLIDILIPRFSDAWHYDRPVDLRVAVLSSLQHFSSLMLHPSHPLGESVYVLWEIWFAGLMTDLSEIAAESVNLLKYFSKTDGEYLDSLAVLYDAIDTFLDSFSESNCCSHWRQIFNWTWNGLQIEDCNEIKTPSNHLRIFCQEEFNLSRDDTFFIQTLIRAVHNRMNDEFINSCCQTVIANNQNIMSKETNFSIVHPNIDIDMGNQLRLNTELIKQLLSNILLK